MNRIDLADIHKPALLAGTIHCQIGPSDGAIPVDEIAFALDIGEVRRSELDGVEGMLLTDRRRSAGSILVNTRGGRRRARFSIAHELGHFLMERHVLGDEDGFTCSRQDMSEARQDTRYRKQEAQANEFAIALLAPASMMRSCLADVPELRSVFRTAHHLDLSREATLRRYIDLCDEPVAAIWTIGNKIRTAKRNEAFPWIQRAKGDKLSELTQAWRAIGNGKPGFTEMVESTPAAWATREGVEVFEQTRVGNGGHAVTLLWATLPDEEDPEEREPVELGLPRFRRSG